MRIKPSQSPRQDYQSYYNSKDYYKFFKKRMPGYSPGVFRSVNRDFNKILRDLLVEEGFEWNMFGNIGRLAVYKYKPEIKRREDGRLSLPINAKATGKLWKEKPELKKKKYVYHLNEHSDGYVCKIFWVRHQIKTSLHHRNLMMFIPSREFKRMVYRGIVQRQTHENYFVFEAFNTN